MRVCRQYLILKSSSAHSDNISLVDRVQLLVGTLEYAVALHHLVALLGEHYLALVDKADIIRDMLEVARDMRRYQYRVALVLHKL